MLKSVDPYKTFLHISLLIGVIFCVALVVFWLRNLDIAPDQDMVATLYFLLGGQTNGVPPNLFSSDLFLFLDNEHRPFLPVFIWALDLKLFGSRGYLPQILILVFCLASAILVTGWSQLSRRRSLAAITLTVCACVLILSPMHYENLVWPKQVHVLGSIVLSILAFAVGLSIPALSGWHQIRRAILTSALAFAATFSFAYGLVVWPVLLLHGALARWPSRSYAVILLVALTTAGLYYSQYVVLTDHSDPGQTIFDPLSLTLYAARLLATPLAQWHQRTAELTGVVLIVLAAALTFRFYFMNWRVDTAQSMSVLVCMFTVGIALLTALGRVGINEGNDSRYLVVAALFLLAFPGLFPYRESDQGLAGKAITVIFVSITLFSSARAWDSYEPHFRDRQFFIREGAIAAALNTQPIHRGLFHAVSHINDLVWPFYAAQHQHRPPLEVFGWIGKPLPLELFEGGSLPGPQRCPGFVDLLEPYEKNLNLDKVVGWARLGLEGESQATWVLITNEQNSLVGLATTGRQRPDVARFLKSSWLDDQLSMANRAGFEGLVMSKPGESLNFYAYSKGGACLFASNVSAPG